MDYLQDQQGAIAEAVEALRRGECVGMPTETVYGLAADARNVTAVQRVFELKGRPADHPLIVHLPSRQHLGAFAREIPDVAWRLANEHWPGALTLVVKREFDVPLEVTGGQDTIAVRVPSHPVALELLRAFDGGLAAPSANRFGRVSPTRPDHVRSEFGDSVPIVLDGGPSSIGIESTIVDCTGSNPRILRLGMLSAETLGIDADTTAQPESVRVPGSMQQHYAPDTPIRLMPRAALGDGLGKAKLLAIGSLPPGLQGMTLPDDPAGYARGLYAALRELDALGASELRIETPPDWIEWEPILDRLTRAAAAGGG
jgi:L-threonylcarbamoyladenylate synthase